ncbi:MULTISPECIES: hypothetical protein [unclassified Leptospira]|uniref:Uncharacterized protein n=1 Tax=Leptospira santarosai TaxID=28183 RepID=A0A2P1QSF8_9LEPT|nr:MULTISPECIES: hypothetical protein [unclassified Leptospira]AVQ11667.1 Uncharacterized protein XB16_1335 [Leptospira santarosai]EKO77726.1 hypothetical protein LEP1GSC068_2985 [Leptospira sp. Fiocruz LV3954]EMI65294.1 hypothetical protein LEP1GSC076_1677 [Leptospira sp. Fiocruz LV4135]
MAKDWKGFDPKNPKVSDLIPFAYAIYGFLFVWSFFPFLGIIPALIVIPFNKNKFLKYLPLVTNLYMSTVYLLYLYK